MSIDYYNNEDSAKVKARANFKCEKCGSTERLQSHAPNGDHSNWEKGMCLCAKCHSKEHPNVREAFFYSQFKKNYFTNITLAQLARENGCHTRTIIRTINRLNIKLGCELTNKDKEKIKQYICRRFKFMLQDLNSKELPYVISGEEIRIIRKKLKLTQEKFAKLVGVTLNTINRWENNKMKPHLLATLSIENIMKKYL